MGQTSGLPVHGVSDSVPIGAPEHRAGGPVNRQTGGPMPLGYEARSHACQRRFGRQRQSGGPFPLTPTLSPEEREPRWPRYEPAGAHDMRKPGLASPSPWGEGRGEGELCSRRFHGASSSEHGTLQTRGQFLAALDKNVCPTSDLNSYESRNDEPRPTTQRISRSDEEVCFSDHSFVRGAPEKP